MKTVNKIIVAGALAVISTVSSATLITLPGTDTLDFIHLSNVFPGEKGFSILDIDYDGVAGVDLSITAGVLVNNVEQSAFAYLDAKHGGLGVCKVLDRNLQCDPGNDDNTTVDEFLDFKFTNDTNITNLWFNNLHDGDRSLAGDTVLIDGTAESLFASTFKSYSGDFSIFDPSLPAGGIMVSAGSTIRIAYSDESFYVSGMQIPEPSTLLLLGLGLVGLGGLAKYRKPNE